MIDNNTLSWSSPYPPSGRSTRTASQISAATTATLAQAPSVAVQPKASLIRGTAQIEITPPRFPMKLSNPPPLRGWSGRAK